MFSAFKLVVLFYAWLNCFLCFTPIITNYRAKRQGKKIENCKKSTKSNSIRGLRKSRTNVA